jgi:hypothetical protein
MTMEATVTMNYHLPLLIVMTTLNLPFSKMSVWYISRAYSKASVNPPLGNTPT